MWYIVSPRDQAKLDRLAQGMFPQLYTDCHAFMRHKEILLSPALLHSHGIPFMKVSHGIPFMKVSHGITLWVDRGVAHKIPNSPSLLTRMSQFCACLSNVSMQAKQEAGEFIVLNSAAYHW